VVDDPAFAQALRDHLCEAMTTQGRRMDPAAYSQRPFGQRLQGWLAYALMRLALLVTGQRY
jgi:cardiolipin synthase